MSATAWERCFCCAAFSRRGVCMVGKDAEEAMELAQFRMKDIVDMESGEVLLELEHEIRCRYANKLSPLLPDAA